MMKFNRNYVLQVGLNGGGSITIEPPFTVEFDITRSTLSSANVCSLRIFNLSKNHRNQIRFNTIDTFDFRPVLFRAGYGNNLATVFSGNITQAWSVREETNFITTIESFDAGNAFNTGFTNTTFPAGTPYSTVISELASSLPNTQLGAIGQQYTNPLPRGSAFSGTTIDLLKELTGGGVFVDNGQVNCLADNECLPPNGIAVIDDSEGLLGTPVLEQTILTLDMIFEPHLAVGQYILLNSSTGGQQLTIANGTVYGLQPNSGTSYNYNGAYKVVGVKHRGMISSAVCGDAVTSVRMFCPPQALIQVPPA